MIIKYNMQAKGVISLSRVDYDWYDWYMFLCNMKFVLSIALSRLAVVEKNRINIVF